MPISPDRIVEIVMAVIEAASAIAKAYNECQKGVR